MVTLRLTDREADMLQVTIVSRWRHGDVETVGEDQAAGYAALEEIAGDGFFDLAEVGQRLAAKRGIEPTIAAALEQSRSREIDRLLADLRRAAQ